MSNEGAAWPPPYACWQALSLGSWGFLAKDAELACGAMESTAEVRNLRCLVFSVVPRRIWHANGTVPQRQTVPWRSLGVSEPQPTEVSHDAGCADRPRTCVPCSAPLASATLPCRRPGQATTAATRERLGGSQFPSALCFRPGSPVGDCWAGLRRRGAKSPGCTHNRGRRRDAAVVRRRCCQDRCRFRLRACIRMPQGGSCNSRQGELIDPSCQRRSSQIK